MEFKKEFDVLREKADLFKLRGSTLVVELLPEPEIKTKGGLIISAPSDQVRGNTNDNKLQAGVVLMAGEGYYDADSNTYTPTDIQPGAVIILPQYSAQTISKFPGISRPTQSKIVLVKEDSVLAYYTSREAFEQAEQLLNGQ